MSKPKYAPERLRSIVNDYLSGRCRQELDLLTKAKILLKPTVVPAEQ